MACPVELTRHMSVRDSRNPLVTIGTLHSRSNYSTRRSRPKRADSMIVVNGNHAMCLRKLLRERNAEAGPFIGRGQHEKAIASLARHGGL